MQVLATLIRSENLTSTKTGKPYTVNKFHCEDEMTYITTFGVLPEDIKSGTEVIITFGIKWENMQVYPKHYAVAK